MRSCFVCAGLALMLVAAPAGQTQKPAAGQPAPAADMTLTGCLGTGQSDTPTRDATRTIYTIEVGGGASSARSGGPPAGGRDATASKTTYSLSANESIGLAKHVGHQVQLTGQLLQPPSMPPGASGDTPIGSQPKPLPRQAEGTFRVSALKMISAKCQ